MIAHEREPIKHTCPDIDKYIKWIKQALTTERELGRLEEAKDLYAAACSMANQLEDCIGFLEELRQSNSTLREWGIEEAETVDRLSLELDAI